MPNPTINIHKLGYHSWDHETSDVGNRWLSEGGFFAVIDSVDYQYHQLGGATGRKYRWQDVTIQVDAAAGGTGTTETGFTRLTLIARLTAIKYPVSMTLAMVDIVGLISADGGNTLTTGSDGGLYATSGGTGSTPHNDKVIHTTGVTITVPAGFSCIITNLTDIYSTVVFTVSGTDLTIVSGAVTGELLLINGKY